ncbi:unnamed protein product [Cunninghamella blakesleeana]
MTNLQVYAHRLGDPNLGINLKVTIANELRDQVEVFQTLEYSRFLSTLIPVFLDILQMEHLYLLVPPLNRNYETSYLKLYIDYRKQNH